MAAKGWQRAFDDPIPLPRGRQLVMHRDAAEFITELPKAEHDAEPWQAKMLRKVLHARSCADSILPVTRCRPCWNHL
jgi:hypothetical protein